MERINWIDWAKATAITMVVFGHIPENPDNFLIGYICTFHMPLFFFISGYLTKKRNDIQINIYKYWHSLIIPYFLYNTIFYPYWFIRYFLEHGGVLSFSDMVIKPALGVLFGQIETSISYTVSGVTWFLLALLLMRIIVDWCNNHKKRILLMTIASFTIAFIYISSEYYNIMNNLLMKGFTRCFPFFVLGHLLQHKQRYAVTNFYTLAAVTLLFYTTSITLYLLTKQSDSFCIRILSSYSISLMAIIAVLSTCKFLNSHTSNVLVNISNGTIMIMGLHWMCIGVTNFLLESLFGVIEIRYEWYTAVFISISIITFIYPIIVISKNHIPILLGKITA